MNERGTWCCVCESRRASMWPPNWNGDGLCRACYSTAPTYTLRRVTEAHEPEPSGANEPHPPDCPCHEELPHGFTLDFEDGAHGLIIDSRGFRCALAQVARQSERMQRRLREPHDTEGTA